MRKRKRKGSRRAKLTKAERRSLAAKKGARTRRRRYGAPKKRRTGGRKVHRRSRAKRRKNPTVSPLGQAMTLVVVGSVVGAAIGGVTSGGGTNTLPGALAGASGACGLLALVGVAGAIFDVEAGLLTFALGLVGSFGFGVAAAGAGYTMGSLGGGSTTPQVNPATTPAQLPASTPAA